MKFKRAFCKYSISLDFKDCAKSAFTFDAAASGSVSGCDDVDGDVCVEFMCCELLICCCVLVVVDGCDDVDDEFC